MPALLLEGKALAMLRPIPSGEGIVVWRRLVSEYEPDMPASSLGRMKRLMAWSFGVNTIEQDINEFDVAIQLHERFGSTMPDDIKLSILISGTKDRALQQWLMVNSERMTSYDVGKKSIKS